MTFDTATTPTTETVDATLSAAAAPEVARLDADLPSLAILQRRYIDRVLERTGRNKTRAARMLGIDRRTLNRMLARERAKKASVTA